MLFTVNCVPGVGVGGVGVDVDVYADVVCECCYVCDIDDDIAACYSVIDCGDDAGVVCT